MILILEPNADTCKKLCDLLHKERIIGVDSGTEIFELLCKYKTNINAIIGNVSLLGEILSHKILIKLCKKLAIETPPILGYYTKHNEKTKQIYENEKQPVKFIEYNEKDENFPEKFIQAIKQLYPKINADLEQARDYWSRDTATDDLVDFRKWLAEEFPEKDKQAKESPLATEVRGVKEKDYKKMYYDLKKKYDELLKTISELMHDIDDNKNVL